MICRPLREDTRHAATAVVGMRDAYHSFEAEEVGQHTLKLGLREGEGLYHQHRQQGESCAFPKPSAIRKRSPSLALLYAVRKARPQKPRKASVTSPRPSKGR